MGIKDENLMQLEAVAAALDDLLGEVTFVGGATTILLVDEAFPNQKPYPPKCMHIGDPQVSAKRSC